MIPHYTYRPMCFFCATFLLWSAGAYLSFRGDSGLHMLFMLPGLMAPFLISLLFIRKSGDARLTEEFLNRLFNPGLLQPRMLPALVLIMPLSVFAAILISLPYGGTLSQFRLSESFSFTSGFIPVLHLLVLAACFEELGWRGYAFDSLQSRYNYFWASVIFSVLWSLWHLPLIWVKDSYQYRIFRESICFGVNFYVGIIPMGIIISWICPGEAGKRLFEKAYGVAPVLSSAPSHARAMTSSGGGFSSGHYRHNHNHNQPEEILKRADKAMCQARGK